MDGENGKDITMGRKGQGKGFCYQMDDVKVVDLAENWVGQMGKNLVDDLVECWVVLCDKIY